MLYEDCIVVMRFWGIVDPGLFTVNFLNEDSNGFFIVLSQCAVKASLKCAG